MSFKRLLALLLAIGICLGAGMGIEAEYGLWQPASQQAGDYIIGIVSSIPWPSVSTLMAVAAGTAVLWAGLKVYTRVRGNRQRFNRSSLKERAMGHRPSRRAHAGNR
ncbi:hypothetical protein ACP3TJ_09940 [Desulforudis sp. 1088]|uniref:hypothetical protein n=1 Tax=unclassified Candidatus Desulforudis TaxID=2635950 RepID=UPI00348E510E